ncbi:MAG: hypothetical protein WDW38_004449 [Sanguina aurantia]
MQLRRLAQPLYSPVASRWRPLLLKEMSWDEVEARVSRGLSQEDERLVQELSELGGSLEGVAEMTLRLKERLEAEAGEKLAILREAFDRDVTDPLYGVAPREATARFETAQSKADADGGSALAGADGAHDGEDGDVAEAELEQGEDGAVEYEDEAELVDVLEAPRTAEELQEYRNVLSVMEKLKAYEATRAAAAAAKAAAKAAEAAREDAGEMDEGGV